MGFVNFKYRIAAFSLGLAVFFLSVPAFAIGEVGLGINVGATYDVNNLESEVEEYNIKMKANKELNDPGAEVSTFNVPYAFVYGFNARYQYNYFLFRLGCHYAKNAKKIEGSFKPSAGEENKVKITSYQVSFPLSIGIILPLKDRAYVYLGAGPTLHHAFIKMTQSKPEQTDPAANILINPDIFNNHHNRRDRYSEEFAGFHFILGVEVPVAQSFTITTEWIHQKGKSFSVNNDGMDQNGLDAPTPERKIYADGDFVLFGVNYYINI